MQREIFASTRSGGDALKQSEHRCSLLQGRDEKFSAHSLNAANGMIKVDRHGAAQLDWIDKIASCPVYYPTADEFFDPLLYIQKIAPEASEYGICKVVPPVVASVPAGVVLTKEQTSFKFTTMIQPMRLPNWDKEDKNTFFMSGCYYTLAEYEKVASKEFARKFSTAAALPAKFVEAEFWNELVSGKTFSVEYANDVEGSAFSKSPMDPLGQSKWNLKKISRLSDSTLRLLNISIPGVTEPMLYIGMLFSMFAWHVEDHYLYSINYHHCGAPKTWYGVPGKSAPDFEKIVEKDVYQAGLLKDLGKGSHYDLLLQKTTMFAPKLLLDHGVPVFRAIQNPGEFIITFPRAYHAGFSHGFNCGEAVNFAMADWFPFGAAACLRYEFLNRIPLLPHEELLCREAMLVSPEGLFPRDLRVYEQQSYVKIAFVGLMRSQLYAHQNLKKRGAKEITSCFMNVHCGLCKHGCYVAYSRCSCYPKPTCLNHDRFFGSCICGSRRSLVVREDLPKLQAVAQMYESEKKVLTEAMKEPSIFDAFVGNNGIGGNSEEEFLIRSLSTAQKASDVLPEASSLGEKGSSCEGDSVAHEKGATGGTSLDSKQLEEGSSDSEAFRVKRRRASHSRSRRFQVDEQDVEVLIDAKPQISSESHLKEKKPEPCLLFVRDVMNKLGIKGPKVEVIRRWQHCARRRGLSIRTKWVPAAGRLVEALSFKSCLALKQLLTKDHALRLEKLMQQVPQLVNKMANPSCGTLGDIKPASMTAAVRNNVLDGRDVCKSMGKCKRQMLHNLVSEVDPSIEVPEEDARIDGKRCSKWNISDKMPAKRDTHSENSSGVVKDKAEFDRKQNFKGKVVNDRMVETGGRHLSRDTSLLEGSSNCSESHCRKGAQAVRRLKIKSSTSVVPAKGSKCAPCCVKDDARSAGLNDQKHLHNATRNATGLITGKKMPKDQGKGRAQATAEVNHGKMGEICCSQEGGTIFSANANKKRGRDCVVDGEKPVAAYSGLASTREPICDSSSADSFLENQKVDFWKTSGNSSQLPPMTSDSIKDSNTALCSISEDGEVSDTRAHMDVQDSDDRLSQRAEHKPDKLTIKLMVGKIPRRA